MLYTGVKECVVTKLRDTARIVASAATERLIEESVAQWDTHRKIMGMIADVLMYLVRLRFAVRSPYLLSLSVSACALQHAIGDKQDKNVNKVEKRTPTYPMGIMLFRDEVLRSTSIRDRLRGVLLDNIARERSGELIDRVAMKNCLLMLVDSNVISSTVYVEDFETEFLEQTRRFYRQESQDFIAQNTVPDYLRKVRAVTNLSMSSLVCSSMRSSVQPVVDTCVPPPSGARPNCTGRGPLQLLPLPGDQVQAAGSDYGGADRELRSAHCG